MLAKEPVPGRVKTRLCPPCSPEEAAAIAAAALSDTFDAALASGVDRVVAVLDGRPGDWLPPRVVMRAQSAGTFNQRLAAAWAGADGPALQIGMDTPQVSGDLLASSCAATLAAGATFGPATDGGWWALGLRTPRDDVFTGVPPSTSRTGARQLARLQRLGIAPALLPAMRDVDTWEDARAAAALAPDGRFAVCVAEVLSCR